jgi:hypothetical protein
MTTLACAVGGVEGEGARLKRRDVNAAIDAGHALGIELLFTIDDGNQHRAARQLQSRTHGFCEPLTDSRLNQQAINHSFNRMIAALVQAYFFIQRQQLAVNASAKETVLR